MEGGSGLGQGSVNRLPWAKRRRPGGGAGDLILAEVACVSESFYEVARPGVAAILRSVLAFPAIRVVDADLLQRAVEVYEVERRCPVGATPRSPGDCRGFLCWPATQRAGCYFVNLNRAERGRPASSEATSGHDLAYVGRASGSIVGESIDPSSGRVTPASLARPSSTRSSPYSNSSP